MARVLDPSRLWSSIYSWSSFTHNAWVLDVSLGYVGPRRDALVDAMISLRFRF